LRGKTLIAMEFRLDRDIAIQKAIQTRPRVQRSGPFAESLIFAAWATESVRSTMRVSIAMIVVRSPPKEFGFFGLGIDRYICAH
jgi:hypothetical protein